MPPSETVRTFILWFGVARRGLRAIRRIRRQLDEAGIETDPDFALSQSASDTTIGDFLAELAIKADLKPRTLQSYAKALRKIVADIFKIGGGNEKCDEGFYLGGPDVPHIRTW